MTRDILINAICPSCGEKNGVAPSFIGKKIICQKCEKIFTFSDPSEIKGGSDKAKAPDPFPELIPLEPVAPETVIMPEPPPQADTGQIPVIAKLALIYKLIDKAQCMKVVSRWQQEVGAGKKISIDDLFKVMGVLTPSQISHLNASKEYLDIKKADKNLCDLALAKGFILPSDAVLAMETQARQFREKKVCLRVGDILMKAEVLTENEYQILLKECDEYARKGPDIPISTKYREPATPERDDRVFEKAIQIRISEDGLRAYLSITGMARGVTLDDVKKIMEESQIKFGVVEEKLIETFIHDWAGPDKELKIAEGVYPVQGENASIRFLFDTDHLKVGTLSEDGGFDFKNRGVIPFARKGDLLAEKIPLKPGKTGLDVHGYPVEVAEALDIEIIGGEGVTLSPDKCQIYADIDGYPNVNLGQVINMYPGIRIKGDVGYHTGHVIFDGHVHVEGVVKEGFKVKGTSLFAQEIIGAEIEVTGDVIVQNGIIGATITAQGNVNAMHMRNTHVSAYGDIVVVKEIADSTIVSSGACLVTKGLIVSSDISVKKGVRAKDIGTEISSPNRLRTGSDRHIDLEIEKLKKIISQKEGLKEALTQELQKTDANLNSVYNVIAEMAHFQDRLLHKKEAIIETLLKFEQKKTSRKLIHAEKALEEIDAQVKANDQTMDRLFATQNAYQDKIGSIKDKLKVIDTEILERDVEKKAILAWSSREKRDTTIFVTGAICEKTVIYGVHSSKVLPDTYKNVRIKEVHIHDPSLPLSFEIRVYENGSERI